VSPIFIRPVREQLEHDRLIRHLQAKYQRKFEVAINVGEEQISPVKIGSATFFPDVVLTEGRKLAGLAEVETGESVNNLEAMAQWVHFSRARVPFHLYVPVQGYDAARRLLDANQAKVTEIWTYRPAAEGFDLVRMFAQTPVVRRPAKPAAAEPAVKAKPNRPPAPAPTRAARAAKSAAKTTPPAPAHAKTAAGSARSAVAAKARPARSSDRLAAARKKAAPNGRGNGKKAGAGRRR
jgi:hypothetical protein